MNRPERVRALSRIRTLVERAGGPDAVRKSDLVDWFDRAGITVRRADGEGEPLKADYLRKLGMGP